jgi:hypothetical protein
MKIRTITALAFFSATLCLADGTVEQKTQFHLAGPMGGLINVFSRSAREGVTSTTTIKGNRKLTRSGDSGELIDLDQEKVYTIDYGRQSYTVKTFAEMRKEWEEQREKAKKQQADNESKSEKNEGPEYEVEFDLKSTGKKETINGFNTHQEIATVTVHEKGRKLEQSGGFVLTSDMWMGPKVPALREITDFDRRFAQKLYGPAFAADMRSLAAAMALQPAFGKAMKTFQDKRANFDGTAIRTNMRFETVAGTDQPKEEAKSEDAPSAAAQAIGGLFNKMKNRRNADKKPAESSEPTAPGRSELFTSTLEVNSASSSANAAELSIPTNFRQR